MTIKTLIVPIEVYRDHQELRTKLITLAARMARTGSKMGQEHGQDILRIVDEHTRYDVTDEVKATWPKIHLN